MFPEFFGQSPGDFLQRFERLIYKIIYNKCMEEWFVKTPEGKYLRVILQPEDVFMGFLVYIAQDNYRRLCQFEGRRGAKPSTYLVKILKNFISNEFKKEVRRIEKESGDEEAIESAPDPVIPDQILIANEQEEFFNEALVAAFSMISSYEERLIVALFYGMQEIDNGENLAGMPDDDKENKTGMTAKEISRLLMVKEKRVFKIIEKFKKFLKNELLKRGIFNLE